MKKNVFFSIVFMLLVSLTLFACKPEEEKPELIDLSAIDISIKGFVEGDSLESVTSDFELPIIFADGVTATWESSDLDVITISGKTATVTRAVDGDKEVNLTATLKHTAEGEEERTLKREPIKVIVKKLDYRPTIKGDVYHWMPDSVGASITATVNLFGVEPDVVLVTVGTLELIEGLDYEIVDNQLEIFGEFLIENSNEVGDYELKIETDYGFATMEYYVVDNPENTSIKTKEIEVSDMGSLIQANITEPILGAPKLMITEVAADAGKFSYVEVFNNSKEKVNLKGHMLIFGNTTSALNKASIEKSGLIAHPMGRQAFLINKDVFLEPFETGLIWHILGGNDLPWIITTAAGANQYKDLRENPSNGKNWLFDWQGGNLKESDFRKEHNINDDVKVIPVRAASFVVNQLSPDGDGIGTPARAAAGFTGNNSSVENRGVQLSYIDPTIKHDLSEAEKENAELAAAKYFIVESFILNPEEEIYVDGVLDTSKISIHNGRQSINALVIRKVYYNANDEVVAYAKDWNHYDEAGSTGWGNPQWQEIATSSILSTALFYGQVDSEGIKGDRWGIKHGMEYALPETNSHVMRFVPRSLDADYETYIDREYSFEPVNRFFKLGLSSVISGLSDATRIVVVPENPAYVYEIKGSKQNSAGITSKYNLGLN